MVFPARVTSPHPSHDRHLANSVSREGLQRRYPVPDEKAVAPPSTKVGALRSGGSVFPPFHLGNLQLMEGCRRQPYPARSLVRWDFWHGVLARRSGNRGQSKDMVERCPAPLGLERLSGLCLSGRGRYFDRRRYGLRAHPLVSRSGDRSGEGVPLRDLPECCLSLHSRSRVFSFSGGYAIRSESPRTVRESPVSLVRISPRSRPTLS